MTMRRLSHLVVTLSVVAAILAACGSPAPQPPGGPNANGTPNANGVNAPAALPTGEKTNVELGPNDPQIFMLEPLDGSSLSGPIFLRVGVANFPIPISGVKIHVAIDAACAQPGETVPEDAQHVSLPLGTLENSRFDLPVGQHRLCIQASNRDNIALDGPGMMRVIDLDIVP
jgi:hypothetical protein